jgi:hypothetical protein
MLVLYFRGFAAVDSPHTKGRGPACHFLLTKAFRRDSPGTPSDLKGQVSHQKWLSAPSNFLLQCIDEQDGFCQYRGRR